MRKLISSLFVAFVLLVGVAPVQAQIFDGQYGPADQLLLSNLNMVDRWMWYGNMYGFFRGGNFYGMYGRDGRRLSRPVRIAIAGAQLGATIGYAKGGGKGALVGAGIGAAPGLIAWALSRGGDKEKVVELPDQIPPMPTGGQQTSGRENGWNPILRNQSNTGGNPWFGSYRGCMEQGMFTLKNETGEVVRVYQDGQPYAVLGPRQSECGDPFASYDAEAISAVSDGYTATAGVARAKPEGRSGGVWIWR